MNFPRLTNVCRCQKFNFGSNRKMLTINHWCQKYIGENWKKTDFWKYLLQLGQFFLLLKPSSFLKKNFLPKFFFCVRLEKNFRNMSVFQKQMEHRKTYGLAMLLCDLDISVTGHDITWHHDVMVPRDMTYTQHVPSSFTTHNTVCAEFIKYNETFLIIFFMTSPTLF